MISVRNPGGLIAALPGTLGFTPVESLAVVALEVDKSLKCVLRVDIADVIDNEVFLEQFAQSVDGVGAHSAVAVWVTDAADAWDQLEELTHRLRWFLSVELTDAYFTDNLVWRSESGAGGDVDSSSLVSAVAVADGRRQYGSRAEVTALLAPTEVGDSNQDVAVFGRSLLDGKFRDQLYSWAVGDDAHRVEDALIAAARVLPGECRAHALAAVAFFAYCRGDGVLAGEAVLQSLAAGEVEMARLLDTAMRNGVHPKVIRGLATAGVR